MSQFLALIIDSQGAKCGQTTIDRNLHKLMEERYGEAFASLPIQKIGTGSAFMNHFETTKRDFNGKNATRVFELPLKMRLLKENDPSVEGYDFEEDQVLISRYGLAKVFNWVRVAD